MLICIHLFSQMHSDIAITPPQAQLTAYNFYLKKRTQENQKSTKHLGI